MKGKRKNNFSIVGIGASAGGLHAIISLLQTIPEDTGMAFVIIQHLVPNQKSLLPEILAKSTTIPLIEVTNTTKVKANHIYVMPEGVDMMITDNTLTLTKRKNRSGTHRPINTFFKSLAIELGKRAIGVLLSGTGTDGTEGLKAIKTHKGITIAQDGTAQYQDMPQSAIDAGVVDFVLAPAAIIQKIIHPLVIDTIFNLLKAKSGIDFSQYKSTTVTRRLQRRMMLNHLSNLEEYHAFLTKNPHELEVLQKDMLIHVTHFFREPEQFEVLKKTVLPTLLKKRRAKESISVWIPGCATGEEVYSFAILFREFLSTKKKILFKIIGSDISEDAIKEARAGLYQRDIEYHVSVNRLRKFFTKVKDGYQVKKGLLDICKFLVHDVTNSPPVSQVDLISCRNVLIYLGPVFQQKAYFQLHRALAPDGFLILGKSESMDRSTKLFSTLDSKQRVYIKNQTQGEHTISSINKGEVIDTRKRSKKSTKEERTLQLGTNEQMDRQQKIIKLRQALGQTQEYADEIISELDVMNEELHSTNEELLVANEELQSSTEELETAQEELQSSNEELKTLNEELEVRNEEIAITRDFAESIIKTVREPLLVLDHALRIKSANQSFYQTFKVAEAETIGKFLNELEDGQWDIPALRKLLLEILPLEKKFQDFEVVHEFPQIGRREMLLNARRLLQKDKKEALILLAIEDVTQQRQLASTIRKQVEQKLAESEQRYKTLVETSPDSIVLTDLNANIIIANEQAAKMNGVSDVKGIIGRNAFEFIAPEDQEKAKENAMKTLREGSIHNVEYTLLNAQGKRFAVELSAALIRDNNGQPVAFLGITRDITQRKQAEQNLQFLAEASKILSTSLDYKITLGSITKLAVPEIADWCATSLLENGALKQVAIAHKDPQKVKWAKEINKKYPPDIDSPTGAPNVIRTGKSELYPQISDEMLVQAAKDKGKEYLRLIRSIGFTSAIIVPIRVEKKCIGGITFVTTETRRRYTKADLAIAEELAGRVGLAIENAMLYAKTRKSLVLRDDFISMASHELKTPITTVKALAQILLRPDGVKPKQRMLYLEKMNVQIDRLTELVTDLLDISKIEKGRLELIKHPLNFDTLVKETIAIIAQTVKTHKIYLRGKTNKTVVGDRDRISQVIINLLTNAVKYSPKANKVLVSLQANSDSVSMSVRDYGIGIARKDQSKIFERFHRVIKTTAGSFPGLGVGLYISAQIAKRHGGDLIVKSKPGQGSTFTFTLPLDSRRKGFRI